VVYHQDDPDDNRGGCRVTAASEESLAVTAGLMGLDGDELRRALTARVMQATKAAVQLLYLDDSFCRFSGLSKRFLSS